MKFNFGEVLTRAWQIIWKHKVLWIFGIFAGCSSGSGGGGGGSGGGGGGGNYPLGGPSSPFERSLEQFGQWIGENPWVILLLILVGLVIIVLAIYLSTIGRIGLIKGTYKAEQGAEQLLFGELFSESAPYFWRVFGLSFLVGLVFLILAIPIIAFGALTGGIGLLCLIPLICILVPLGLVVNVIIEQSNAAMVLEDLGIADGWRRGWGIVRSNLGPVLVMTIILAVISFMVGLVIALPIIIVGFLLVFGLAGGESSPLWIALACCALYIPVLLVLNGILTAFVQSSWTLTYLQLTKPTQDDNATILEANA